MEWQADGMSVDKLDELMIQSNVNILIPQFHTSIKIPITPSLQSLEKLTYYKFILLIIRTTLITFTTQETSQITFRDLNTNKTKSHLIPCNSKLSSP